MKQIENIAYYRKRPVQSAAMENPFLNEFGEEVLDDKPHQDLLASPVPLPLAEQINNLTRISRTSRLRFLDELDEDDFGEDLDDAIDDPIGMTPSEFEALSAKLQKYIEKAPPAKKSKVSKEASEVSSGDGLAAPTGGASEGTQKG